MNDARNCERVRGRLFAYLDASLEPVEQALDRGHMECCQACVRERDELSAWLGSLRASLGVDSPALSRELPQELDSLGQRLKRARPAPWGLRLLGRRSTLSLLTAAAAVLLLMAMGFRASDWSDLGGARLLESLGSVEWSLPAGDAWWGSKQ